jgi:hypothetical protein
MERGGGRLYQGDGNCMAVAMKLPPRVATTSGSARILSGGV